MKKGEISADLPLNIETLKRCREQIGLSAEKAKKKVPALRKIESGDQRPTYKQLDKLAALYGVPRWVFISKELPEAYCYNSKPSFRKFKNSPAFSEKLLRMLARVEQSRDLLIELRDDLKDSIEVLSRPELKGKDPDESADLVRAWLGIQQGQLLGLEDLKQRVEKQNIFVFLTSKYKGWAQIEKEVFRGLCLDHETLPIIVINNSDSRKAQAFTLMHELGHLLRGEMAVDIWKENNDGAEKWCDEFAGKVLMPREALPEGTEMGDLGAVKLHAQKLKVSPWALLVRLNQERIIRPPTYHALMERLEQERREQEKALKNKNTGPPRNRPREVHTQFGNLFINTLLTAWHSEKISLHKASQLLGLKRVAHVIALEK